LADRSIYITDSQYEKVLKDLDVNFTEEEDRFDLLDRAVGDMEADLVERFIVPLLNVDGGAFSNAPIYARNKIVNVIKNKIRQLVGRDHNRNLIVDSTQKYIDVQKIAYQDDLKVLMDPKKVFGFKLQPQSENAVSPIQSVGVARADNRLRLRPDYDAY
jgi:hypothetical protein